MIGKMVEIGNPNSVTDAGVGALCARTAVNAAFLNVKVNISSLKDEEFVTLTMMQANIMLEEANQLEKSILEKVNAKL
jgi:glutamate formiminotransferase/formiminotetrahydrofolate cyclodeaminase